MPKMDISGLSCVAVSLILCLSSVGRSLGSIEMWPPQGASSKEESRPYTCKVCARRFDDYRELIRHLSEDENTKVFAVCRECSTYFISFDGFRHHVNKNHLNSADCPQCSTCGKRFQTNTHLRRHELIHSNVKAFQCPYCGSAFRRRDHMLKHMRHVCRYRKDVHISEQGDT